MLNQRPREQMRATPADAHFAGRIHAPTPVVQQRALIAKQIGQQSRCYQNSDMAAEMPETPSKLIVYADQRRASLRKRVSEDVPFPSAGAVLTLLSERRYLFSRESNRRLPVKSERCKKRERPGVTQLTIMANP